MQRLNVVSRHIAGPASVPFDQNLVEVETADEGRIAIVSLNRPKALNALNNSIIRALNNALLDLSEDPKVACVILTGRGKAFAAGADITELNTKTVLSMRRNDSIAEWERVLPHMKIPVIAAVNGVAFGGGCEIAMMCDIILASEKAKFGQPEIKLGLIPGAGGTQRLTKAVGKSHAMLMCLGGEPIDAHEAKRLGLVAAVFPPEELLPSALGIARQISRHSIPVLSACKEAVKTADEQPLSEGIKTERRLFHAMFALSDSKEGTGAFVRKRKAQFTDS